MANEKKSIIEEALLEAENIDATFKSNAKEILAHTMSSEIEEMVKESLTGSKKRLKEDEEEEIDLELDSNDENEEEMDLDTEESDEDMDMEDEDMEDSDNEDMDMDMDTEDDDMDMDTEDDDMDMDFDLGDEDMGDMDMDLDLGDETEDEGMMDTVDLTQNPLSDVISVFKKMGPEDEIEVVNDNGMVTLKDNKSGSEYRIELNSKTGDVDDVEMLSMEEGLEESNQVIYEIVVDDEDGMSSYMDDMDDMDDEDGMSSYMNHDGDKMPMYMKRKKYNTNQELASMYGDKKKVTMGDVIAARKKGNEDGMSSDMGMKSYMKHSDEDYASRTKSTKGRYHTGNRTNPNAIARMGNNSYMGESKTPQISKLISENTILNESVSTFKSENEELKANQEKMVDALKQFRNKLQEVAVFNSNLTYAVRLFTEQSTTKNEKQEVLKRLDSAKSLKESQSIYKQLVKEFSNTKAPIKESIDEKLNKTSSSGSAQISEQTVFVHPELQNMKKLWEYGYKK